MPEFKRGDILRVTRWAPFLYCGDLVIVNSPGASMEVMLCRRYEEQGKRTFIRGPQESYFKRVGRLKPDKVEVVLGASSA